MGVERKEQIEVAHRGALPPQHVSGDGVPASHAGVISDVRMLHPDRVAEFVAERVAHLVEAVITNYVDGGARDV